jgi:seryl-tRNA synthetase
MLDIKYIRENAEKIKENSKNRGITVDVDRLLDLDTLRRDHIKRVDELRAQRNQGSKGKPAEHEISQMRKVGDEIKQLEFDLAKIETELNELTLKIPNITLDDVPIGKDESENKILKKWGNPTKFDFDAKDHMALGETLGIIDMDRAAKVAGARFGYKKGAAALLDIALIQFVMETLTSPDIIEKITRSVDPNLSIKPFIPVLPPVMIKPDVYARTGRLTPEDADEKYKIAQDELYLIGSAEHTIVAMHMDEILDEKELPLRYIGFSTCFRREAGSYGKDTKGMLRVHQFDKLEMETFSMPETSLLEHKFLVAIQEYLVQQLELPYQVVINCTGDMGKPNARQIDIETWMPGQNKYRETHSADYMTDYQARGLNIKFKSLRGDAYFVHTNDATAIAMSRIPIAIVENNQQSDGSILIPKVLQKYFGKDRITKNG